MNLYDSVLAAQREKEVCAAFGITRRVCKSPICGKQLREDNTTGWCITCQKRGPGYRWYSKEVRERMRAEGKCTYCHKTADWPGECQACRDKRNARRKRRELEPGYLEKRAGYVRDFRKRMAEKGKCGQCGETPLATKTLCEPCRVKQRKHDNAYRARKRKAQIAKAA